ncbi:hypothetical protein GF312_03870, partial [Candidatus Poribacteria bacterium]|nr:hypothetical protein [Candidatus Poribacteria bacterium]
MSQKTVVIFEDNLASNLNPLALTRPVFELMCGMKKIWENIINRFYPDAEVRFICRSYLKDVFQQKTQAKVNDLSGVEEALFINGRILAAFSQLPPLEGNSEIGVQDENIVCARLKADEMSKLANDPDAFAENLAGVDVPKGEVTGIKMFSYLWELISYNSEAIGKDFEFYADPKDSKGIIDNGAFVRVAEGDDEVSYGAAEAMELMKDGKIPLYLGEGARINPNVTLDLTEGPIYIGSHIDVRPPTLIDGPCCMID